MRTIKTLAKDPFESLGLPSNLCQQLHAALPHITTPTPVQAALIPAMLSPRDVILLSLIHI